MSVAVSAEMGSAALLTAVLAGALLSISAIHAGESLVGRGEEHDKLVVL